MGARRAGAGPVGTLSPQRGLRPSSFVCPALAGSGGRALIHCQDASCAARPASVHCFVLLSHIYFYRTFNQYTHIFTGSHAARCSLGKGACFFSCCCFCLLYNSSQLSTSPQVHLSQVWAWGAGGIRLREPGAVLEDARVLEDGCECVHGARARLGSGGRALTSTLHISPGASSGDVGAGRWRHLTARAGRCT